MMYRARKDFTACSDNMTTVILKGQLFSTEEMYSLPINNDAPEEAWEELWEEVK